MKTIFKPVLFAVMAAGIFTSCVNDDDYDVPNLECIETTLVKNKEVQDVPAPAVATQYLGDDVIEAYVTSSDLGGNFYKSISLQTLDGSVGFSVPVDVTSYFTKFEPGRKVLIKLDSTYTDTKFGSMRIGALYNGEVGRLSLTDYNKVLNRSCTVVSEEQLVKRDSVISNILTDARLNTLIELKHVQFTESSVGGTYYDSGNDLGGATNLLLEDTLGNTLIFRTSSFASYAGDVVPNGSGTVRGVLTKFNNDYQFISRTGEDIKLDQPRKGEEPTGPGESPTAVGGTALAFTQTRNEMFEEGFTPGEVINYSAATSTYPGYINDAVSGPRYWAITKFGGNQYLQMSSFNTSSVCQSYFIVPVDFTGGASLSFKTKDGYNNGSVLKVYYSTDYVAGSVISEATLIDITSNFVIANSAPSNGYAPEFTDSGSFTIPASGNGFIFFEYSGAHPAGPTTTMQLDDIVIN